MKVVFVYNPKSGSALSVNELQKMCHDANISVEKFIVVDKHLKANLQLFIKQGAIIATVGGDGTISSVAQMVVGTRAILAPLPGGTLNHFTKDLGVPQVIDEAIERIPTLSPRSIDVAKVNNQYFINNSSIGIYPAMLRVRETTEYKYGKWPAAVYALLRVMAKFQHYTVTIDNETIATPFLFVGNNNYDIGMLGMVERNRIDAGMLSVYIAKVTSHWQLVKIIIGILSGRSSNLPQFEKRQTKKLHVMLKKSHVAVARDGEVTQLHTPLEYSIEAKKLTVLA